MVSVTQTLDLTGKLLIAMPGMGDKRFDNCVIYLCSYSAQGTMGLILNQPMAQASFGGLCKQLSIENSAQRDIPVLCGGPVEANRGFVLHSRDYHSAESTQHLGAQLALTSTRDVIEALAQETAPNQASLFMGYAGWGAGQLDAEIARNSWLLADADEDKILQEEHGNMRHAALDSIGIDARLLSTQGGRA